MPARCPRKLALGLNSDASTSSAQAMYCRQAGRQEQEQGQTQTRTARGAAGECGAETEVILAACIHIYLCFFPGNRSIFTYCLPSTTAARSPENALHQRPPAKCTLISSSSDPPPHHLRASRAGRGLAAAWLTTLPVKEK